MLYTIIIFALIISILVFVHEVGHFISAKKLGVRVEEFGFGIPPKIFGIKKGNTTYSINWLPLGGFVRLKGENEKTNLDKDSFGRKKPWQRSLILLSGVLMNFALAVVIIAIGFMIGYPQIIEDASIEKYAHIENEEIRILSIMEGSPAEKLGIPPGAIIDNIDGMTFDNVADIQEYVSKSGGSPISLGLKLEEGIVQKEIIPVEVTDDLKNLVGKGQTHIMGASLVKIGVVRYPFYIAAFKGIEMTFSLTKEIVIALSQLIKNLIFTRKAAIPLTGPVGIAILTDQAAQMGFIYLLQFIAILSINLGIINLLPFPALDGGRLLFIGIEKIRRKEVNQNLENIIHNIGFVLLLLLIIFITYKDILTYQSAFINLWHKIKFFFGF